MQYTGHSMTGPPGFFYGGVKILVRQDSESQFYTGTGKAPSATGYKDTTEVFMTTDKSCH